LHKKGAVPHTGKKTDTGAGQTETCVGKKAREKAPSPERRQGKVLTGKQGHEREKRQDKQNKLPAGETVKGKQPN